MRRRLLSPIAAGSPNGFFPCEGGVLELSGVFGGSFSFSRSAAFSARNDAKNSEFSCSNSEIVSASFRFVQRRET